MATSASFITSPVTLPGASTFLGLGQIGCVLMEPDGRIVSVTPSFANMLESEVEPLFGQSVFDLLTLDETQPGSLLADGRNRTVVMGDGHSALWSAYKIAPGAALNGYYVGLLCDEGTEELCSRELTQGRRLAMLGGLTAEVAHEIAGPLNIIANYAALLLDEAGMTSDAGKRLTTIRNEAFRLNSLLQEILNFASDAPPRFEGLEPVPLLNKSLELFNQQLDGKEITWRIEAESDLPQVVGDADRLHQVFFNIFKNAWDASPNGSEILIHVRRQESEDISGAVEFVIEDKGEGISPFDMQRIYDPFFTTKSAGQGTGLGLAIVRRILTTHRGSLQLTSSPGKGTSATISLPIFGTTPKAETI